MSQFVIPVGEIDLVEPIPDGFLEEMHEKLRADQIKSQEAAETRKELDKLIAKATISFVEKEPEKKVEINKKFTDDQITIDEKGRKRGPNGRLLNKDGTERKSRNDTGKPRGPHKKAK